MIDQTGEPVLKQTLTFPREWLGLDGSGPEGLIRELPCNTQINLDCQTRQVYELLHPIRANRNLGLGGIQVGAKGRRRT